jgi:excisionase family DNA binding protein
MNVVIHPELPKPEVEQPLLVSVENAARMLGIGRSSMWKLISRGEIGTRRIGRRTLIRRQALENFVGLPTNNWCRDD